ncbi:unnamed protein product [Triticum aestivum]|uniref:Uncharacterized protein n=1 Tax=Triticum aestivum TaxID=4565 RepID=A0A7H4LAK1_WHEAT|nr:unnamed protein product [Triticum aestivum]
MHKLLCAALLLLLPLLWSKPATSSPSGGHRYKSIFSFGDSFADTGNNPVVFGWYSVFDHVTRPPYGTTFFGRPTGRNGDGRLIIDFIECKNFFGRSLFLVGEFGVNDYHFSFQRKTVQEVRSFIPDVVATISMAIERLIKHGARRLVVPGVIPSGCSPPILTKFAGAPPTAYDSKTGCLTAHNELGLYHNLLLQAALAKLRTKHRNIKIIYADFFGPIMEMVESPHKFGFEEDVLMVCCGGPGRYGMNSTVPCGDAAATTCRDPSARLYWDGVHLTEAANRHVADVWLGEINPSTGVSRKQGAKGPCRLGRHKI